MNPTKNIEVKNLSVHFKERPRLFKKHGDGVWALKSVSCSVGLGDTLAVIGESGSGKTTLLRSMLGLVSHSSGSVELFGGNINAMTPGERLKARRRCGYVLQDPYSSLPPTLTVMSAVTEPWNIVHPGEENRADGVRKASELLTEFKLPEKIWNARVRYSLSGGQRQRVSVARALMLDPELLLCDEPTAMQDASTRGEVLDILKKRARGGMSMIIVTHDLFLARNASSRGIVLYGGEIVESGDTNDLMEHPAHSYTKALISALPKL